MRLFYLISFCILCQYLVLAFYSCRKVDDCIVDCLNIPSKIIYNLRNMSSIWFPVLRDDGNCYLHNDMNHRDKLF